MKTTIILLTVLTALLTASWARADELTFTNGDRLTGTLMHIVDGTVTFDSAMLGTVTVKLDKLTDLRSDTVTPIHLADGSTVMGRVAGITDGTIQWTRGDATAGALPNDVVTAVNPPVPPAPAWKGNITVGASSTHGNTFSENASVDITASLRRDKDRTNLFGRYLIGRSKDDNGDKYTDEESVTLGGKYDYFFTKKWYGLVNARYKKDHVADLDYRLIGGVGVGYQWIETDPLSVSTEAGLSELCEQYTTGGKPPRTTNSRHDWPIMWTGNSMTHCTFCTAQSIIPASRVRRRIIS